MNKGNNKLVALMLMPTVLLMVGLVFWPIIVTFSYSLKYMKLTDLKNSDFVGLANYATILKDPGFWYSFWNSMVVLVVVVALSAAVGLAFALLLNVNSPIKGFLTAVAIIPWALPPIVNGIMWRWIFHPSFGFINKLLMRLGVVDAPIQMLSSRFSIILVAALVTAWRNIPFCAVVLLSALQSIPPQLYEASCIDGCGRSAMFWRVTFPLLIPSLVVVLTSSSITAINVFDEIVSLNGYGDISKTLMINSYIHTFSFLDFGAGSALTYLIMIIAGVLGIIYIKNIYKEVEYL